MLSIQVYKTGGFCIYASMQDNQIRIQVFASTRDQSRKLILSKDESLLLQHVEGLANNMLWIFGHIVRTTDFLLLKLSGQPMQFPTELDAWFAKGSSPAQWQNTNGLKEKLIDAEAKCQKHILDYLASSDLDAPFADPYTTSSGMVLGSLGAALLYNTMHEGIHLGQLQLYNKLVK